MKAFYIYTEDRFLIVPVSEISELSYGCVALGLFKYYVHTKHGETYSVSKKQFIQLAAYFEAEGLSDALIDFESKPEPICEIGEDI